jgi:putative intracellular protease/amidase
MILDRALADAEDGGDALAGMPAHNQRKHLSLTFREIRQLLPTDGLPRVRKSRCSGRFDGTGDRDHESLQRVKNLTLLVQHFVKLQVSRDECVIDDDECGVLESTARMFRSGVVWNERNVAAVNQLSRHRWRAEGVGSASCGYDARYASAPTHVQDTTQESRDVSREVGLGRFRCWIGSKRRGTIHRPPCARIAYCDDGRLPILSTSLSLPDRDAMKILIVLTSHDQLGKTDAKTGYWLEEYAAPYYTLLDAGAELTVASPKGGRPPLDPASDTPEAQTGYTTRLKSDAAAQAVLDNTVRLDSVHASEFDAVFFPGGHGPMWDLAEDKVSIALIESFAMSDRPIVAVCHAPAVLRHVRIDGKSIVAKKRVTGFSNAEEEAVKLTKVVPFLVEDELKRLNGFYESEAPWTPFVVVDGQLITGQNPASSGPAARELLALLAPATLTH